MLDEVASIEAAESQLNAFIERRAKDGRSRANEEAAHQRAKDTQYSAAARLVNARAWAEYFGGLAIASHDAAARYAEKRDEALAIVRELEANDKGDAA